ncbi:MAG: transglycosylase SLT domain-containing protein [Thermodesulfobacteriota bacterium]
MKLPASLIPLIESAAKANGLPANIVSAIVQTESSGNTWATRYEPGFYERYVRTNDVRVFGPVSIVTEKNARATSWGLMQIMGETARCLGFNAPFLAALCDPMVGLEWGCKYLMRLKARYFDTYGWPGVVAAYNAGSPRTAGGKFVNQAYVDKILEAAGGEWPPKE